MFYNKLKRKKGKQEEVQLRKYQENKIDEVEAFVKGLKKFCKNNNFGNNNENIEKCIQKLLQIVKELKNNNMRYENVAFLYFPTNPPASITDERICLIKSSGISY